jgi:hypothetical protein
VPRGVGRRPTLSEEQGQTTWEVRRRPLLNAPAVVQVLMAKKWKWTYCLVMMTSQRSVEERHLPVILFPEMNVLS